MTPKNGALFVISGLYENRSPRVSTYLLLGNGTLERQVAEQLHSQPSRKLPRVGGCNFGHLCLLSRQLGNRVGYSDTKIRIARAEGRRWSTRRLLVVSWWFRKYSVRFVA